MPVIGAALVLGARLALLQPVPAEPPPPESPVPSPPNPATIDLHWQAPPQCPTAEAIEQQYRSLLTGPLSGVGTMRVDAQVSPTATGYHLALTTDYYGQVEQRQLDAADCSELAEATAIVVAVSLQPTLDLTEATQTDPNRTDPNVETTDIPEPESSSALPSSPPPAPELPPPEPLPSEPDITSIEPSDSPPPRSPLPRPQLALRLSAGVERGVLSRTAGLGDLTLGLVWPRFRLDLSGRYLWPRRLPGPDQASALIQLGAVSLMACARPHIGPVEIPLCGGLEAGVLRADSRGLDPPDRIFGPWMGPSASAGIAHHWSRVGIWASAMLVGRAWATRTLLGSEATFLPAIVSVRGLLGVEVLFSIAQP